jgi:cellulose synthase (UDP-forming)
MIRAERDPRFDAPRWSAAEDRAATRRVRWSMAAGILLAIWYLGWLVNPDRIGHPVLFVVLISAELFNLIQAAGFWWTSSRQRHRAQARPAEGHPSVDVFVPVYDEPVNVVEPTLASAVAMAGARVTVHLLDDGHRDDMEALAARHGARYVRRPDRTGAKAGNINHALRRTDAEFVAVFDCDHVPEQHFLDRTLGHFDDDPRTAFVQTPQYYANGPQGGVPAAAWSQQALFFGPIARGKDGLDAMFCCGTNMVFRRSALQEVGGFPEGTLTEDFELSVYLHERGYKSLYVAEVLAKGLGPEDMASYVGQQMRWARGCLSAIPKIVAARLGARLKTQYLLSSMFFLSGWTALIYISLPVIRIVTGAQPLASASADQFLLHFAPYFGMALLSVAVSGRGAYSFDAFALSFANFWIHILASVTTLLRRPGKFVVTPKQGLEGRQPKAVVPGLAVIVILVGASIFGLSREVSAAMLNNVAFATLHVVVISCGVAHALRAPRVAMEKDAIEEQKRAA